MKSRNVAPRLLLLVGILGAAGCATPVYKAQVHEPDHNVPLRLIPPVVAVTDFENRSNFSGQWHLGSGMADLLATQLLDTGRVTVLERRNLDDVVGEIVRQSNQLFRREGRVAQGKLKNARYLVRGIVTDFAVTSDVSGWFGMTKLRSWGRGQRSRVAVNVQISDVETGEILSSVRTSASASAGWFGAQVNYKEYQFGGDSYFRTPLGQATETAIARAVEKILKAIPPEYWKPMIAEAGPDTAVVNGGLNVKLKEGQRFQVRGAGRDITDPHTGDVLERVPGPVKARIRLTDIRGATSLAVIEEGQVARGDLLELLP